MITSSEALVVNGSNFEKLVTIIIVNFNSGRLLNQCIQSVLLSNHPIEIFIVDNNSQDDSIEKIESLFTSDERLSIIRNSTNTGFAYASNQPLNQASGKYCLFLNPDCMIHPDTISEMYQLMEKNPEVAMSGPLIINPDGSEQRGCRRAIPTPWRAFVRAFGLSRFFQNKPKFKDFVLHNDPLPENPVDVEAISGAFMFVRNSVIEDVGPLDDGYFLHCEDLDWCMRFRQKNWRILFTPKTVITHTKGGCSQSKEIFVLWHMHKGMVRFYNKFFKESYPRPLMWLVVASVWLRFFALAGYQLIQKTLAKFKINKTPLPKPKPELIIPDGNSPSVIVTGATSLIGHFLLPRLQSAKYLIHAFSRSPTDSAGWHTFNESLLNATPKVKQAESLIHLGPLWALPNLIDDFVALGGTRIIAFSSTSRFSKLNSSNESERQVAESLIAAEDLVAKKCQQGNIALTIFRSTLIYGAGLDKNVSSITKFIKRFSFFPLVGEGSGLRQPVHADDLASACLLALNHEKTFGQSYNLVGGESLTYNKMVEYIFIALNKKPRFLPIPLLAFRFALRCVSVLPAYSYLTPNMANRMNQNLCFNSEQAINDFGYANRTFAPQQEDLEQKLDYARL